MNTQTENTSDMLGPTQMVMVGERMNDLDRLRMKQDTELVATDRPEMLAFSAIKEYPDLFQPRVAVLNERHIQELVKALKQRKRRKRPA
jgi:hypothetical protein